MIGCTYSVEPLEQSGGLILFRALSAALTNFNKSAPGNGAQIAKQQGRKKIPTVVSFADTAVGMIISEEKHES